MLELYKNIKKYRLLNDMSQEELAKKVGYADKTMISRIESGKVDLSQSKVEDFARAFNITPGYRMGWNVPMHDEPSYDEIMEVRADIKELVDRALETTPEDIQIAISMLKRLKK